MRSQFLPVSAAVFVLAAIMCLPAIAQKADFAVEMHSTSQIFSVAFSPGGRMLATGNQDDTIRLWDLTTGRQVRALTGHIGYVHAVAFSPDGSTLISGSEDKTAVLWDLATGQEIRTVHSYTGAISSIALSPDGHTLVTTGGRTLWIWDLPSGREILSRTGDEETRIISVAFSLDGYTFAWGSNENSVGLAELKVEQPQIDPVTGRARPANPLQAQRNLSAHADSVTSVAFSHDGRTLASGSVDDTIKLWDVASGLQLRTLAGHADTVTSLAFSPDGRLLASASIDATIILWDTATGQQLRTLIGHSGSVASVAFSPDGRTLASGGEYSTVKLWDVSTGHEIQTLRAPPAEPWSPPPPAPTADTPCGCG
jgi:WD40 repeat protein